LPSYVLSSRKCTKTVFGQALPRTTLGELTEYDALQTPNWLQRGSLPILFPFDAFAVFDLPDGVGRTEQN